jgi:phenylacetate-CoA ligase
VKFGSFLKARLEHGRNARRSTTEIDTLQHKKFRRLVAYAGKHSPYYRDLISARAIEVDTCMPADFPPLTRSELTANFDRIVTDPQITAAGVDRFLGESRDPNDRYLGKYTVISSTGTFGKVGNFVFSPAEWARGMALLLRTFPFTPRRRRIAIYGLLGGHQGGAIGASTSRRSLAKLRFVSRSFDVEDPVDQIIDELNRFQPDIVSAQPTALTELAGAQESGLLHISPQLLSLGGDALVPAERALLDRAFEAKISNHYASAEHFAMGYGLSEDQGMYLFEDEFIFEIEEKCALVTNLFKYTQPLIRYVMDDRLVPVDDPDPRLPFTKIRDIGGRPSVDATFVNQRGEDRVLRSTKLAEFSVPNVERIQLRVFDELSCLLRVKLKAGLAETDRSEAIEQLERWLTEIFTDAELGNVSRRIEEVRSFGGRKARLVLLPGMLDTMTATWRSAFSSGSAA